MGHDKRFERFACVLVAGLVVGGCMTANGSKPQDRPSQPDAAEAGQQAAETIQDFCASNRQVEDKLRILVLDKITTIVRTEWADKPALVLRLTTLMGTRSAPDIVEVDLDNDGRLDKVIVFGGCYVPAMVFKTTHPSEALLAPVREEPTWSADGGGKVVEVADLTGDGQREVVIEYRKQGGSSDHKYLYVYKLTNQDFTTLFYDHVSDWVGINQLTVEKGTIRIQCYPLGPFEVKLMEHRQLTETYAWDPAAQQFSLTRRSREPITSQRLQVAEAELFFQRGQYSDAIRSFDLVKRLPVSRIENDVDWIAYAHFRSGQIRALEGAQEVALSELGLAQRGQEPIATMATVFRQSYRDSRSAPDAMVKLWQWIKENAYQPNTQVVLSTRWPQGLDPNTVGARTVILDAFQKAGRTAPDDLPRAVVLEPENCMNVEH